MLQATRHLAGGRQNKGVRAGGVGPQQAVIGISYPRVLRHLGKVAAHQREIMALIHAPNAPDALHGLLVADVAAERIARIRGIGDHTPGTHDLHRALDQARLRVERVDLKVLSHG